MTTQTLNALQLKDLMTQVTAAKYYGFKSDLNYLKSLQGMVKRSPMTVHPNSRISIIIHRVWLSKVDIDTLEA